MDLYIDRNTVYRHITSQSVLPLATHPCHQSLWLETEWEKPFTLAEPQLTSAANSVSVKDIQFKWKQPAPSQVMAFN